VVVKTLLGPKGDMAISTYHRFFIFKTRLSLAFRASVLALVFVLVLISLETFLTEVYSTIESRYVDNGVKVMCIAFLHMIEIDLDRFIRSSSDHLVGSGVTGHHDLNI
jgi:hypothetical protein